MKNKNITKSDEATPVKTLADNIWDEIKDLDLGLFSLPGQFVSKYCTPKAGDPSKLYLEYKGIGAVLPALEELVKRKYDISSEERFIVISPRKS